LSCECYETLREQTSELTQTSAPQPCLSVAG
jgi:hypothetical protein